MQPYYTFGPTKRIACLQSHWPDIPPRYWRDKAGNEIDFVLSRGREAADVIECKWNPAAFDPKALTVFRSYYPKGRNYLLTPLEGPGYVRGFARLEVRVCGPDGFKG